MTQKKPLSSALIRLAAMKAYRRRKVKQKVSNPAVPSDPIEEPIEIKTKNKLQDQAKTIAELEILQRKFEMADNDFPELAHVAIQRGKDGMYPAIHSGYESTSSKFTALYWYRDEKTPRESCERGFPTKHWLCFFDGGKYDVPTMIKIIRKFSDMAWKAGEIVANMDNNILPISKVKLWVKSSEEYWILLLHHFNQPQWWTLYYPKTNRTLLTGCKPEQRQAQKGDPCFCWVENLFFSSAVLCETLLARLKKPAKRRRLSKKTMKKRSLSTSASKFEKICKTVRNNCGAISISEKMVEKLLTILIKKDYSAKNIITATKYKGGTIRSAISALIKGKVIVRQNGNLSIVPKYRKLLSKCLIDN